MTFNTRRTLLAAALGLTAVVGAASALAGPGWARGDRGACPEDRLARMAQRYELTPEQQTQAKTILEEQGAAARRLHQETRKRIEGLLTEAQRSALEARTRQRLDRRLDRLTRRLNLSPEQATQVRALMAEGRDNPDLDRAEVETRIAAVLNPEQRTRFEAMMARSKGAAKCGPRGGRPMGPPPNGPMGGPMGPPMGPGPNGPMTGPMDAGPMGGPMAGPVGGPLDDADEGPEALDDGEGPEPR